MNEADELIFISIAAYRDAQLVPTVEDCFRKAQHPERVRVGICWQHGPEETLPTAWHQDGRLRLLDVPWQESRGACWARAEVMTLWQEEPWFLQVDSHCRFKEGWDAYLIQTARSLAPARAILSTYATPFTPGPQEVLREAPLEIAFQGFTPEGIPHLKPLALPAYGTGRQPRRARFLSAGFLFAPGSFVREVPYDPGLYFLGEEIAMTVRAFTSGYDLFHPAKTVIWHDYERRDAAKHWDDHTAETKTVATWGERDVASKARVTRLLAGEPMDAFGLGAVRTLAAYETFAGIRFEARKVQPYTLAAGEPPNPPADAGWEEQIFPWMVRLAFPAMAIPAAGRADALLWYIGVHDNVGNEIYRRDLTRAEVLALPADTAQTVLVCEFEAGSVPVSWTVWPLSRSSGWLNRVQGRLQEGDYAIVLPAAEDSEAVR